MAQQISAAMNAMGMGLGDQLAQQAQDEINKRKKKGLAGSDMQANGGPGSVNLSAAASMLFGGKY